MGKEPRLSKQTISVLSALLTTAELSGSEIAKQTALASGSLYPILYRLEEVGWLASRWEADDPASLGRPRKRFYRITAAGQRKVAQVISDLMPAHGRLVWKS
ncbi:PadR family transcriptional regulator [Bradyrhizobium sp. BR 10261]|uniref:PadR family transcriptional regulator n=1 Tax=Bradyrhizobium sp. BR 10261 TaxID=2749992 RepID=UPI001C650088|nr:helix-turn-helix transcriptional regulator [Bradyrhizobium sp. BR 10261]MBW7964965.1 helix-turn-helix transcriptional regulator [Bradyrhizobium sp. BR 10261]